MTDSGKARRCADAFKPLADLVKKVGRPNEGRVKVTWYVLPLTKTRVEYLMDATANTPGKVVDSFFGSKVRVQAKKKRAGAPVAAAAGARAVPRKSKPRQHPNDKIRSGTGTAAPQQD